MPKQIKKVSLLIFSISNAGGCERIACNLANELSRRHYQVSIINIYNQNASFFALEENVSVLGLYKKPAKPSKYHFPFVPFRILKLLAKKSKRPDVLIGVGTDMCIYALPAMKLLRIPFISLEQFNFNANDAGNLFASLGRKLSARYAQALVVLTTKDKALFAENLSVKGTLVCIPNFTMSHTEKTAAITSNIAVAVGRYTYQKGFDNLIKIWEKVTPYHPGWQLKIIGKGEDQPMLEQMITEKKLGDSIMLVPQSSHVAAYYKEASVFLLSSRWEGLPLVSVEAKSFGLPIVGFDCDTGPRDVINNNVDGILVPDQDNDAFANALIELLADRQRLQNMSREALINGKQFLAETVVPQWEDLFTKIGGKIK